MAMDRGLKRLWSFSARPQVWGSVIALIYLVFLFFLNSSWVFDYSQKKLEYARQNHERFFNLFQSSFYFYYDDQFKPGIESVLRQTEDLKHVLIISSTGQAVFDSTDLPKAKTQPYKVNSDLLVKTTTPLIINDSGGVGILIPSGQYSVYYVFSTFPVLKNTILLLVLGLSLIGALVTLSYYKNAPKIVQLRVRVSSALKLYSLRAKLVGAIVFVNIITGAIIFASQSHTQKKEQTERIVKSSVMLSELTRDHLISSFSNFFYFYYQDKFVPIIKQILATKENLMAVRIISRKSGMIVFDSDEMNAGKQPVPGVESRRANLSEEALAELKTKDTYFQTVNPSSGEPYIQIVTTYRNENQETPFLIEYLFSFASLKKRIFEIRKQIFLELLPSMALGLVVAFLFSQVVVSPVRKLVAATQSITGGNYDIRFDTPRRDEIGDLMRSFNVMVFELKRKGELKKYLSDQSYRRIVESPEGVANIGGSRVNATILFCDIRNFVNVCESLDAEEVTSMLNEYFSSMVEVIYKHRGEVDKFIGDAILAVFYDQTDLKQPVNTALHSIYCAMEMREKLAEFNSKRVRDNKSPIDIGIGINSGEIISGPIGSRDRMDFTVIGDVVNLANRIEKLSKQGKHTRIVFSHRVEERIRGLLDYEELSRDKIRGKEEEVIVYELVKIKEVSELLANLSHPEPSIKRHCIELLGYSRNREALPSLYQKLSDSSDFVRVSAVIAITRLVPRDYDEALDHFFRQLDQESSEKVISTILISIGKICKTSRLLKVARFLDHPEERIVANAIEALGASDDPAIIDLLIPFVASKHNRVKANAAMVLFAKGRVEVIDTLKPMLLHSDRLMRASACFALGELTLMATADEIASRIKVDSRNAKHFLGELQGCVPLLVSLLKDSEPLVKRQAVLALGKIKDKSSVLPLIESLNLESDSKEVVHEVAEALRSIGSHRLVREVVRNLS